MIRQYSQSTAHHAMFHPSRTTRQHGPLNSRVGKRVHDNDRLLSNQGLDMCSANLRVHMKCEIYSDQMSHGAWVAPLPCCSRATFRLEVNEYPVSNNSTSATSCKETLSYCHYLVDLAPEIAVQADTTISFRHCSTASSILLKQLCRQANIPTSRYNTSGLRITMSFWSAMPCYLWFGFNAVRMHIYTATLHICVAESHL